MEEGKSLERQALAVLSLVASALEEQSLAWESETLPLWGEENPGRALKDRGRDLKKAELPPRAEGVHPRVKREAPPRQRQERLLLGKGLEGSILSQSEVCKDDRR